MSRVFVTGLGFISSIGNDEATVVDSLRNLKHGMELFPPLQVPESPVKVAAPVKEFDVESYDPEDWTYPAEYKLRRETLRSFSPHVLYAYCSMKQAIEQAGLETSDISNPETGIYTASAGSSRFLHKSLEKMYARGIMRCNPLNIVSSVAGTVSFNLVSYFQIQGFSTGFASACASSGHALGFAFDEVRRERQKRMFVIGAEDCNFDSIVPFAVMRALSLSKDPDTAARPFDKNRQGFVSSGGGVTMILESEEEVTRRGASTYGELIGWGQASDGYNVAISHPDGRGLQAAMKAAFKDANIEPENIGYLNAHAPSTPIGDLAEVLAMKEIFPSGSGPMISSTKALTGHGLSLSSLLESSICILAFKHGFVPGSAHIQELMPEADSLNIIQTSREVQPDYIMSNSSGFGGANTSLIFRSCRN
ncbi:MAG: beta-ketoacyl-[acyl-carrier-protein] synthase family protein [Verrucomicrobia bacterium]|nr:beta-ketoacyl-[acyl-carrier-protein] synthase family protein [Verrucomicrobiota bacterium]